MEKCFNNLLSKRPIPINDNDKEINKQLKIIASNLKIYESQIKDVFINDI